METKQEAGWQGISGSTLKCLAVATMLIDHIAAVILVRMFYAGRGGQALVETYGIMRGIGRFAFPVYCFLLVEGLEHTRSRWKYVVRLGAFALISEIPFDLAFSGKILEFENQNVFFTLAIGLITLIVSDRIEHGNICLENPQNAALLKTLLTMGTAAGGMLAAAFLGTDYGGMGVACILVLYYFRKRRIWQLTAGCLAFVILLGEPETIPAFLVMALYKGKKGFSAKAFFYGFYPVHLILLYLVCVLMGLGAYPCL